MVRYASPWSGERVSLKNVIQIAGRARVTYFRIGRVTRGARYAARSQINAAPAMQITGLRLFKLVLGVTLTALVAACGSEGTAVPKSTSAATLNAVEVTSDNAQAAVGTTAQLKATALYSDGTHQDVTDQASWSSSNMATVATSNSTPGQVSSVSSGTATISATLKGMSGSLQFVATPATLVSLQVTPSTPSVPSGMSVQLVAIGTFSDHTTQDLSSQATWSSADTGLATVSNTTGSVGLLQAIAVGSTSVTATSGSIIANVPLQVTAATLASIQVTPGNTLLAIGGAQALAATGVFSDGSRLDITSKVSWTSSNSAAVTLDTSSSHSVAVAAGSGVSTMTATLGNISGTATVSVTSAALVSIQVVSSAASVPSGNTLSMSAVGTFSDNTTQNLTSAVTWSSDTPGTATVSNAAGSNGLLRALTAGTATIKALLRGVTSMGFGVTVSSAVLVSIEVAPTPLSLARGTEQQLTATGVYSDRTLQDLTAVVTWSTSDQTVGAALNGTVSPGLVQTSGVGNATITATIPGGTISGTTPLTVSSAALVSLAVTSASGALAVGTTQSYVATGTYSDQSTQNLSSSVTWASDQPTVATISNVAPGNGLVSAVSVGTAHISASLGTVASPSVGLTVTSATLVSIQITAPSAGLPLGTSETPTATGTFSDQSTQDLTAQVVWFSSNPQYATFFGVGILRSPGPGFLNAVGMGNTNITASLNGVTSAPFAVSVTSAVLTRINILAGTPPLFPGQTEQAKATGVYSDSSIVDLTSAVTWGTDLPGVDSVSNAPGSNGTVTAVAAGIAVLSAQFQGIVSNGATLNVVDYMTLGDSAGLNVPWGVAVDGLGNVFVGDQLNNRICELNVQGGCTVVASAGLSDPYNVAVDSAGNVYVADFGNGRICKSDGHGGCTTVGAAAGFNFPMSVAVDGNGSVYVADTGNSRICEINGSGGCTVLGGSAGFSNPASVAVDGSGNVYVDDYGNNRICKINAQAGCTVLGAAAGFAFPQGIAVDNNGHVYVADTSNLRVCLINAQNGCTALGGSVQYGHPTGVAVDSNGYVYVADHLNDRIVKTRAP